MAISKAQRKQQQSAADAFDAFFVHEYGAERWHRLRERLLQPTEYAALINAYVPSIEVDRAILSDEAVIAAYLGRGRAAKGTGLAGTPIEAGVA